MRVGSELTWYRVEDGTPPPAEVRRSSAYIGPSPKRDEQTTDRPSTGIQAYLVEMGGRSGTLPVHFHDVDQFQWFVVGAAHFGRHEATAGFVHYADRLTPYGPLGPARDGASFWTLRASADTGAHLMPESRAELTAQRGGTGSLAERRRSFSIDLNRTRRETKSQVLRDDSDGLKIATLAAGRAENLTITTVIGGTGAYLVVLSGHVLLLGEVERCPSATPGSIAWIGPGERVPPLVAGSDGADLGLLQFPEPPSDQPDGGWRSEA